MFQKVMLLALCFLLCGSLFAGGATAPEPVEEPEPLEFEVPPPIPGIPELSPALKTNNDATTILLAYHEFVGAGELLLSAVRQKGLEWAGSGLQSFRNTIEDWKFYWNDFYAFPEDEELSAEKVAEFYTGIQHEDRRLSLILEELNKIIDSQRVLTTDEYRLD